MMFMTRLTEMPLFYLTWKVITILFTLCISFFNFLLRHDNNRGRHLRNTNKATVKSSNNNPDIVISDEDGKDLCLGKEVMDHEEGEIIFAKGMGLHQAVRGRRAQFNIFCRDVSFLTNDLVIQITGPEKTAGIITVSCQEGVITGNTVSNESDFRDESSRDKMLSRRKLVSPEDERKAGKSERVSRDDDDKTIKMSCQVIQSHQIRVDFCPQRKGKHSLSIIWKGRHILSSPYYLRVDENPLLAVPSVTSDKKTLLSPSSCPSTSVSPEKLYRKRVTDRKLLRQHIVVNGVAIASLKVPEITRGADCLTFQPAKDEDTDLSLETSTDKASIIKIVNHHQQEQTTDSDSQHFMFVEDKFSSTASSSYRLSSNKPFMESLSVQSTLVSSTTSSSPCDLLSDPFVVKMIIKSRPYSPTLDAHLIESMYEQLASEALSSFNFEEPKEEVDRAFARLWSNYSDSLGIKSIPWPKKTPVVEKKKDKSISMNTKKRPVTHQEPCSSPSQVMNATTECKSTASPSLISFADVNRQVMTVKERRQLFEQNQETNHKRDHCSLDSLDDKSCEGSLKKLKRRGGLREKKNFWESIWEKTQENNLQFEKSREGQSVPKKSFQANVPVIELSIEVQASQPIQEDLVSTSQDKLEEDVNGGVSVPSNDGFITQGSPECDKLQKSEEEGCSKRIVTPTFKDHSSFEIIEAEEAFDLHLESSVAVTEQTVTSTVKKPSKSDKSSTVRSNDKNDIITSQSVGSLEFPDSAADAFIYDEFEEYSSYIGENYTPMKKEEVTDFDPGFKLSSRMGKMLGVDPEKCKAYGTGLTHGRATFENVFYVSSEGAGTGFLTVGVQGPSPGQVKRVTIEEERDNLYRVSYVVKNPGYFIIFVRFNDCFILDSPFVCQVSDTDVLI